MNLNLGSGQRRFGPGWVNLDIVSRPPEQVPDVVGDGEHLPFGEGAFEVVCLHHVLEHFGCGEGTGMLRESWRVLRPGGQLWVFVPDMWKLARRWLQEGDLSTQVYMTNVYGAYQGEEGDRHRWGYTAVTLAQTLREALGDRMRMTFWMPDWDTRGADIAWDWWILGVVAMKESR